MTAFDFIDAVRRSGGSVRVVDGIVRMRALPDELVIARLNRLEIRAAMLEPGQWPCRRFQSHPTTPTLPCRTCGERWTAHPPELRKPYERPPLLVEARTIVLAAMVDSRSESPA